MMRCTIATCAGCDAKGMHGATNTDWGHLEKTVPEPSPKGRIRLREEKDKEKPLKAGEEHEENP